MCGFEIPRFLHEAFSPVIAYHHEVIPRRISPELLECHELSRYIFLRKCIEPAYCFPSLIGGLRQPDLDLRIPRAPQSEHSPASSAPPQLPLRRGRSE